jgi:hypothetical protein
MEEYKIKIYKICVDGFDKFYIGSTKQPLTKRIYQHKMNKDCKCQFLFDMFGYENCKIILIKEYNVKNMEEQRKFEQKHIDENKEFILNVQSAFTSLEDTKMKNKQWKDKNRDLVNQINKKYRDNNKERIKEQKKIYRDNNRERVNELKRLSYLRCKEKLKNKNQ